MAFEEEYNKINEILSYVDCVQSLLEDFTFLIETDDTEKAAKQANTLKNTVKRVSKHLSKLVDQEELNKIKEQEITNYRIEESIAKVRKALKNNSMIDKVTLNLSKITPENMNDFCNAFGITFAVGTYGDWSWIYFEKDGKSLSSDELIQIGAIVTSNTAAIIEKEEPETKEEPFEEDNNDESDEEKYGFGWVAPDGTFTSGDFGDHESIARDIVIHNDWRNEFYEWKSENSILAGDYLVEEKGYLLLHNPYMGNLGRTLVKGDEDTFTKEQLSYLIEHYNYYDEEEIAHYYEKLLAKR